MYTFSIRNIISFVISIMIISIPVNAQATSAVSQIEERYTDVLNKWENDNITDVQNVEIVITPPQFKDIKKLLSSKEAQGYKSSVATLDKKDKIILEIDIDNEGLYDISIDYLPKGDSLVGNKISLLIDDKYQCYEAREMILPQIWQSAKYPFDIDKKGNEIVPKQQSIEVWQTSKLKAISQGTTDSIKFYLKNGKNKLEFTLEQGSIFVGDIKIMSPKNLVNYQQYIDSKQVDVTGDTIILKEAEQIDYKNSTTPRPILTKDIEAVPYDGKHNLLSTVGGETWINNGEALYYEIDIQKSGWYNISFKAKQNLKSDFYSYRTITIDGQIPFEETKQIAFKSSKDWYIYTLGNESPYSIYLDEGIHSIGIEVDTSLFHNIINNITLQNDKISNISLQIKKIIGNNTDKNRDWEMLKFMPTLGDDILNIVHSLEVEYEKLKMLNGNMDTSKEITTLKIAINQLYKLAEKPNNIPNHMTMFSEGGGSVSQMLGDITQSVVIHPLEIDQIYIHKSNANLPKYKISMVKKVGENIKYFIDSFSPQKVKEDKEQQVIDVWVNRPRSYIDLMQKMIDTEFTPETNIRVRLSLMPNEQKIVLANTTNTQPDVALGLSTYLPYELAIRDAALDLKKFDDFAELASQFSPGAFITHTIEDSIYAFPETQDFQVLFYRKDLLNNLGIPIPDTWDDVKNILPELQRYGMNFYIPLASSSGFKAFSTTIPFIYQQGGSLYSDDGMTVALNTEQGLESIKLMTDLFTIYGMPMQVPNFYQHFRSGTLPIGISSFSDYMKLKVAATELSGAWDIALQPGITNEQGVVQRWAPGAAQAGMIFSKTKYETESWDFLKWWLSSDVQVNFGRELQMLYGSEYFWNTANIEAFKKMPIDEQHKEIILEQWQWLNEVPKLPGSYMVEREISNVWNKIVFDGENPRSTLDDSIILMNREIARKMEEFKYIQNGVKVKDYRVPSVELIESWVIK